MRYLKVLSATVFLSFLLTHITQLQANEQAIIDYQTFLETHPTGSAILPTDDFGIAIAQYSLPNDSEIKAAYKRWFLANIAANEQRLEEENSLISNTNIISYFIFAVTHIFLCFGLYAAYTEFKSSMEMRRKEVPDEQHEIKLGLEGVALKTSLHGTLILIITMGFYYLYLVHVYKITVL